MSIEIKAPAFPESVADGEVAAWHKAEGDSVTRGELLVEIDTDKVVMEIVARESGVLASIVAAEGDTIESEALLAVLKVGEAVKEEALLGRLKPPAPRTTEVIEENFRGSKSDDSDAGPVTEGELKAKVNPFVDVTKLEKRIGNHLAEYGFLYLLLGLVLWLEVNDIPYCFFPTCGQGL